MKFIKWILNGFTWILALIGVTLLMLRLTGICPYAVLSGSMEPEIETGGMVFTDTKNRLPETGDVITYKVNDVMVTHRVLRMEQGAYITKGDANQWEDVNPVLPSQIVGTVCFSIPLLGFIVTFLRNRNVILLFLAVSVLTFLSESIVEFRNRTKNEKRRARTKTCRKEYENQ